MTMVKLSLPITRQINEVPTSIHQEMIDELSFPYTIRSQFCLISYVKIRINPNEIRGISIFNTWFF